MAVVTMKNLLESGVHFGHQTRRWDPRMKEFIFTERNGIHIIDLQRTIIAIKEAYDIVRHKILEGKSVLFVGTKKQAQASIKREAERCDMFFVNNRWLGGMLTNFSTMKKSLLRLKKMEKMEVDGTFEQLTKKEVALMLKEQGKLEKNLGGLKNMTSLPGIIFIVDTQKEAIAVAEARRMGIPIIAVVDTNCNPEGIDYPIPGNDDAIRAINLFTQVIANAVIEADNEQGLKVIENLQDDETIDEQSTLELVDQYDENIDEGGDYTDDEPHPESRNSDGGKTGGEVTNSALEDDFSAKTTLGDLISEDEFGEKPVKKAQIPENEATNAPEIPGSESVSEDPINKAVSEKTAPQESANTEDKTPPAEHSGKSPTEGEITSNPKDEPSTKSESEKSTAGTAKKSNHAKANSEDGVRITPGEVKKLREKTDVGMLDCKKALIRAKGDIAVAEKILKEQGLANADKRLGRSTNHGSVFTLIADGKAAMVRLDCETDFVARNSVFHDTGKKIVKTILQSELSEKNEALEVMVKGAIAVLKENMLIGSIVLWNFAENELVVNYSHNEGQIGALVKLGCDTPATASKDEVRELAFHLALHVTAFNPLYLNRAAVNPAYLEEQKEVFAAQVKNMGEKPEKIMRGIVEGKLKKHLAQVCFEDQPFVKEEKKSVKAIVDEIANSCDGKITIRDYAYIAVGRR